jgi:uncharacterized protein YbjT (DUF2867 family)
MLVTGAAGNVDAVSRTVVELLRQRGLPVRALVHRENERASRMRASGAEVLLGDPTVPADVARAKEGCRRIYFGTSVSAHYGVGKSARREVKRVRVPSFRIVECDCRLLQPVLRDFMVATRAERRGSGIIGICG